MALLFKGIQNTLKSNPFLWVIMFSGAFLRFYHLNFQSVWDDELATLIETDPTLKFADAIKTYMEFDNMPPLYLLLMRYLFVAFGHTALVLRLFSAIMGTAAIGAMFLLGKSLYNRKVGNAAAFIFALNYFQIYYSQEGRPYTFFTLFTILSFYRLVLYVKEVSLKNALYYAFFTLLMLYGQYVALFMLVAQALILLVFMVFFERRHKLKFFLYMIPALIFMAIGYIPALPQLIKNAAIKSSWIPFPPLDVFTGYLSEFFGHSEFIVAIVYLLLILFFIQLLKSEPEEVNEKSQWQAMPYTFVIVAIWLTVYILIPLIRTYTTIPILVSRYFNPLIPAICLMAAIGLVEIKSKIVQYTIVSLIFAFTVVDLGVVKKYYFAPSKTQYRDNAAFVLNHLQSGEPLVTQVWWHYQYFFRPVHAEGQIQYGTLDSYTHKLQTDTIFPPSFWYLGTHERVIQLSSENDVFLRKHYRLERRIDLQEANALHYVLKDKLNHTIDFNQFEAFRENENKQVLFTGQNHFSQANIHLTAGIYQFKICSKSAPDPALNNIQAHLSVKVNGRFIGGFFANSPKYFSTDDLLYVQKSEGDVNIELIYDNDLQTPEADRNLLITSAVIEKMP